MPCRLLTASLPEAVRPKCPCQPLDWEYRLPCQDLSSTFLCRQNQRVTSLMCRGHSRHTCLSWPRYILTSNTDDSLVVASGTWPFPFGVAPAACTPFGSHNFSVCFPLRDTSTSASCWRHQQVWNRQDPVQGTSSVCLNQNNFATLFERLRRRHRNDVIPDDLRI